VASGDMIGGGLRNDLIGGGLRGVHPVVLEDLSDEIPRECCCAQ
jgi:hypothetical protein